MSTFIAKEVPVGAINGSNKTFTLANPASQVDDVFIDGAIYTDFTVVGNVITLTDAPTLSVFVDYWYGGVPSGTFADSSTFGDIKAEVWALLGQKPTSTTFSDPVVGQRINSILRQVCKGRYTAMSGSYRGRSFPGQTYRCGKIWFMSGKYPMKVYGGAILTEDYAVGDSAVSCDTTYLLPSGYVDLEGDILHYTSVSTTQILGVSGGTIPHLANAPIVQLYETPLALGKFEKLYKVTGYGLANSSVNIQRFEIPYTDGDVQPTINYQVVRDASRQLLRITGLDNGDIVEVNYTKKLTDLVLNADNCALPEDYGITVIAPLAAGELATIRNMPIGQPLTSMGSSKLQVMFGDLGNVTTITKQTIKPIPYGKK